MEKDIPETIFFFSLRRALDKALVAHLWEICWKAFCKLGSAFKGNYMLIHFQTRGHESR
jgi:hypothetical protein